MSEQIQVGRSQIPTHLFDGYQVHRAALARGLQVLALPRQVILAGRATAVPSEVSFTHGVPEASTVSAVTYAQDRRLRRALLERVDVRVPQGATFSWKSLKSAVRWAAEVGYPVIVKEVVGENPARSIHGVRSEAGIVEAFQKLRLRQPGDRSPGSNPLIAGYATTRLGYTLDEDGEQVAPLRTRFLIEKDVPGETIRALVCGDEIVAAVSLDVELGLGVTDVTETLHPGIAEVVTRAASAIPGLAIAMVDVVVDHHQKPPTDQICVVVELSERPRIDTFISAGSELGDRIGDALLEHQAARAEISLGTHRAEVSVTALIEGLRDAQTAAELLPTVANEHGVQLSVTNYDDITGEINATCSGSPESLAVVIELLLAGLLIQDRAACVECTMEESR